MHPAVDSDSTFAVYPILLSKRAFNAPVANRTHGLGVTKLQKKAPNTLKLLDAELKSAPPYSSNRSLIPSLPFGAMEASGVAAGKPGSRKRLTMG
jgi:hypothetical protein